MVKRTLDALALLLCTICASLPSYVKAESSGSVAADAIRAGCSVSFSKRLRPVQDDPLSTPPFDISATWVCQDGEELPIDQYGINGASPEVVTALYWKGQDIVVLVKWPTNSEAADYSGDYYKVYIYKYSQVAGKPMIVMDNAMMKNFAPGVDGINRNGRSIYYEFKDATSIRKKLRTILFIDRARQRKSAD